MSFIVGTSPFASSLVDRIHARRGVIPLDMVFLKRECMCLSKARAF